MFQTGYRGIQALHTNHSYRGGFCHFWYIPAENIAVQARINPATQALAGEPLLVPGTAWLGPIYVPRNQLGFEETPRRSKAGLYWETKVAGFHAGDSETSRVNIRNMHFPRYVIVGKMRAGGFYLQVGTKESPLEFNASYKGGEGPADTAQSLISFFTESINKAAILPGFTADAFAPVDGGAIGGGPNMDKKEIIAFQEQGTIAIPWTPLRMERFGAFPLVEVYLQEPGQEPYLVAPGGGSIETDAPPPAFTELRIRLGGNPSGFVVIG